MSKVSELVEWESHGRPLDEKFREIRMIPRTIMIVRQPRLKLKMTGLNAFPNSRQAMRHCTIALLLVPARST